MVAGLNRAVKLGHVGTPTAWRLKPLADNIDDEGETAVFLDPGQRKAIIGQAEERAGAFLRGLELTGARPKELAATKVSDFDGKALRLATARGAHQRFASATRFSGQRECPSFNSRPTRRFRLHLCLRRMVSALGDGTCGLGRLELPFPR